MNDHKTQVFNPDKDIFINGYKCGLRPKEIIAIVKLKGTRYCLVKWKDTEDASYVKYKFARDKFPMAVIKFYEQLAIQLVIE